MISIVILTFNEATNLQRCLDSVRWSDDIVVIDSGSSDDTVRIAEAAGARVLVRPFDSFARQRNHAMEAAHLRNAWVFHLDADEVITGALREELHAIAAAPASAASFPVYRVPSRLLLMGAWLKRSGMYPSYQVRFGQAAALRFVDYGHGQREVQPPALVGTLRSPLDHHNFSKGINDWFARHLRYARAEARQSLDERSQPIAWGDIVSGDSTQRRRALKRAGYRMPLRPLLRFLYLYLGRLGFLDGAAGFRYAVMVGVYQYFIGLNEKELTRGG